MPYEFDPVTIDYSAYPTPAMVIQGLVGGNYWQEDDSAQNARLATAAEALAMTIQNFDESTGWFPFLADPACCNEERIFSNADGFGYLGLETGLLELAQVSDDGGVFQLNHNLWLRPSNAPAQRKPYTQLQFAALPVGNVTVRGLWGRVREVPPDVWYAVLRQAMMRTLSCEGNDAREFTAAVARWRQLDYVRPVPLEL